LGEILRLASENRGKPPGGKAFGSATGISAAKWRGVYWARWNDALAEAGFAPNAMKGRLDDAELLLKIATLCRQLGRLPSRSDMRLRRKNDPAFPNHNTIRNHFATHAGLVGALRKFAVANDYTDLLPMLPDDAKAPEPMRTAANDGSVYLLKSGNHYKVGRSDEIERRVKEVRIALPEPATLVHTIRTDDPPGIEAYGHRRFADRRANGEWFRLTGEDVRAFTRRTFQ
jgi:hypothetical protein